MIRLLHKVWNVPEIIVDHIIILIDPDGSQSLMYI